MDKIVIYIRRNAVMTGILFYCTEHFLYLSKHTKIKLCIIYDEDITFIKNILKEKYIMSDAEFDNIVHIRPIDLLKENTHKAMVLDTDTYNLIKNFTKKITKIFLYSNDNNHSARAQDNTYGFYDYQKFNTKERFKIGFQFMKPKIPTLDKSFCSHLLLGVNSINKKEIEKIATYDVIYKDFGKDLDIFTFKEIVYYHTKHLERNNRIIPEAFYFKCKLILINNENTNDSVNERYNACLNEGVEIFQINDNYKVTKEFLEY